MFKRQVYDEDEVGTAKQKNKGLMKLIADDSWLPNNDGDERNGSIFVVFFFELLFRFAANVMTSVLPATVVKTKTSMFDSFLHIFLVPFVLFHRRVFICETLGPLRPLNEAAMVGVLGRYMCSDINAPVIRKC